MDFDTFLKEQLGYQSGQTIPMSDIPSLRDKYNKYSSEQQELASAIQAALAVFEANLNEADSKGVKLNPRLIETTLNLYKTGQIDSAKKVESTLFSPPPSTQEQLNQMDLETKKQDQALKSEEAKNTYYSAKNELETVKNLLSSDLSDVVGPTEPAARLGRAFFSEFGADWAKKNQQLIKDALMVTTSDVLKSVRALAPVTEQDRKFISEMTVPVETDNDEIWKKYLEKKKEVLERSVSSLSQKYGISENPDQPNQAKSDADFIQGYKAD
jgi:hypothetical protein